jgi:hypothetical protein
VPFSYYARLTKKQKRIYDASDAVAAIELPNLDALPPLARAIEEALVGGERPRVRRASQAFADAITDALEVERVVVRILAKRPSNEESELHGLYVREEDEPAIIRVWMRTAARKDVVKPRTFVRTLIHEIMHHLDYVFLELEDSFHTQGFYRRESSLVRHVLGAGEGARRARAQAEPAAAPPKARRAPRPVQLDLFGEPVK